MFRSRTPVSSFRGVQVLGSIGVTPLMSGAGNHNSANSRLIRGQRSAYRAPDAKMTTEASELYTRQVPGAVYIDEEFPALTRTGGSTARTKNDASGVTAGKFGPAFASAANAGNGGIFVPANAAGRSSETPGAGSSSASTEPTEAMPAEAARVRSAFSHSAPQLSAFFAPASYMTNMGEMTAGMAPHHEAAGVPYGIRMAEQFPQPISTMPLLNGLGAGMHRTRRMRNGPRAGAGTTAAHVGEELATCTLQIELKRFYFDLRANERGPFLKIAEAEAKGTRSKIIIPAYGLMQFKGILDNMVAEAKKEHEPEQRTERGDSATPAAPESGGTPVQPSSDAPSEADAEGHRGSELSSEECEAPLSTPQKERDAVLAALGAEAVASGTPQSAVIEGQLVEIPATGLPTTLASETMRIETKKYYFDLLSNAKGKYLKISQSAGGNKRSSIVVPATGLAAFRDSVHEMCRYAEMSIQFATNPNMMSFAPSPAPTIAYPMFPPTTAPPGVPSALYPSMGPPPPAGATAAVASSTTAPPQAAAPAPIPATVTGTPIAETAASTPPAELAAGIGQPSATTAAPNAAAAPVDVNAPLTNTTASLMNGPVRIPIDEQNSIQLKLVDSETSTANQSSITHLEITDAKKQRIQLPVGSLVALHAVLGDWLQMTTPHAL